jgi:hypothetical protein
MSAFRNEQMKIGISMGAVSERRKLFLAEKKEHTKSESLAEITSCSRANISAPGFWLARKRQSNFSDKYKLGTRAPANSRAKSMPGARSSEIQLFMSLASAQRSVRAREERVFEERVKSKDCIYKREKRVDSLSHWLSGTLKYLFVNHFVTPMGTRK